MRLLLDSQTDPYWNLAAEEFLFLQYSQPVFRLWRNNKSVIVGRNQNTIAQINTKYVQEHQIPVVRRLTGGGTVFHDLGNINFTFATTCPQNANTSSLFADFTRPIVEALRGMNIPVSLEGRNDLKVHGCKVSGNALALHQGRLLMHGTLLYSANLEDLVQALVPKQKITSFQGRAVESHPSRTANLVDYLEHPVPADIFMVLLAKGVQQTNDVSFQELPWTAQEKQCIDKLYTDKYHTYKWNYGESPAYNYSKSMRFSGGEITVYLSVKDGIIDSAHIYGDYFSLAPTQNIEAALTGCPHQMNSIKNRLAALDFLSYFGNVSLDEFLQVIC